MNRSSLLALSVSFGSVLSAQEWRTMSPAGARSNALAFDDVRSRMVLFGGRCARGPYADTWEHDGTAWRQVTTPHFPTPRTQHALAFDRARGRTVLFGGMLGYGNTLFDETWEYDGSDWTQVNTAARPARRTGHALAFHSATGRVLLFGGYGYAANTCYGDTWEYDGVNWLQRSGPAPAARQMHAMAYDSARARTVLFGGLGCTAQSLADTWEWDGASWNARSVTAPARSHHVMAYDSVRARTVLFGGAAPYNSNDWWEFDGTSWSQGANSGPVAGALGMAYDSARAQTMLFLNQGDMSVFWRLPSAQPQWQQMATTAPPASVNGGLVFEWSRGRTILHGGNGSGATWRFDGSSWSDLAPASAAPPASLFGIAYDVGRDRIVRFGGYNAAFVPTDSTWEFDGTNWAQRFPATVPPRRQATAMVYDLQRVRIVLFGGSSGFLQAFNDTWEYDGVNWTQRTPAVSPSPRQGHGMAYDVQRGRTVLFGGGFNGYSGTETWEYDGTNWTYVATPAVPPRRNWFAMTYDMVHGRTLLHGGTTSTQASGQEINVDDTWAYDGINWRAVPTVNTTGGRNRHVMSYDFGRNRCVLVGGFNHLDTWELYPDAAACVRNGTGCPGSAGVPSLDPAPASLPSLASTFTLDLSALPPQPGAAMMVYGFGHSYWNGAPLPQSLAPFGLNGCSLWIVPAVAVVLSHPGGTAHVPIAIPAHAALAGLAVDAQGFSFDAAAPSGIGAVSNAVILVIN